VVNVALYNIEPKIHNTALMQVSQFHKQHNNQVEWYFDLKRYSYDLIYCSSLFDFTDKQLVPSEAIKGGSGYDICSKLPKEIDICDLDYSIYPECKVSYIWFSKGCIRNCPFCIVNKKEGYISEVEPKNLNPNGEYIDIMDNNFFANPNWRNAEKYLDKWNQSILFSSGIDARIFEADHANFLNKYVLKRQSSIHTAWDNPKIDLLPRFKEMVKYVKKYQIMAYVLIGYWSSPEEDMMRVMKLNELGIAPYVMPFNKKDPYQRNFTRWVNHKAIFKSIKWEEYKCTT